MRFHLSRWFLQQQAARAFTFTRVFLERGAAFALSFSQSSGENKFEFEFFPFLAGAAGNPRQ